MNAKFRIAAVFTAAMVTVCASAHTMEETNEVARAMLEYVVLSANDNLLDGGPWIGGHEPPLTWNGFLGRGEHDGWTQQGRKAAFAWYLSTLGTNDCVAMSGMERRCVRTAVKQCRVLNYVESAPALKALALNPRGVCREDAIALTIRFMPVGDAMTEFVETIMTNSTGYSFRECGTASCRYADRLLSFNATNEAQSNIVQRAVLMFYRNRLAASASYSIVDRLFVRNIDSYEMSSNRLEHALNALSLPNCVSPARRTFTSVTNQLLSSGQPLPWIEVGTGGN